MIRVGIFGRGCPGGRLAGILVPSGWLPVCDQIRRGSRMGPSLNRPLVALSLRLVTGRRRGPPPPGSHPADS